MQEKEEVAPCESSSSSVKSVESSPKSERNTQFLLALLSSAHAALQRGEFSLSRSYRRIALASIQTMCPRNTELLAMVATESEKLARLERKQRIRERSKRSEQQREPEETEEKASR